MQTADGWDITLHVQVNQNHGRYCTTHAYNWQGLIHLKQHYSALQRGIFNQSRVVHAVALPSKNDPCVVAPHPNTV